jgi:hypothetical protein
MGFGLFGDGPQNGGDLDAIALDRQAISYIINSVLVNVYVGYSLILHIEGRRRDVMASGRS